jgi:hypothetical protein
MFTITPIKLLHTKGYDVLVSLKDTDVAVGVLFLERKPTKETLRAISIVAKVLFKNVTDDKDDLERKQNIFSNGKLIQVVKDFLALEIKFQYQKGNNYYIFKKGRENFSLEYDVTEKGRVCYCVCPQGNMEKTLDAAIELHTKLNELGILGLTPEIVLETFGF